MFKHPDLIAQVIDALEEVKTPAKQTFNAMVVASPSMMDAVQADMGGCLPRLPRIINWAHRDEVNRTLGRAGEQWAIAFEQKRLCEAGCPELFQKLEWVSDTLGDGTGYDIVSHDALEKPRYIEVKTTNGGHGLSFVISPNQLEFATEHEDAFYLYRIFQFDQAPKLYMLHGRIANRLHLEPINYRASFRRLRA